jgi:hypothetical protein
MAHRVEIILAGLLAVHSAPLAPPPLALLARPQTAAQRDDRAPVSAPALVSSLQTLKALIAQVPALPRNVNGRRRADIAVSRLLLLSARWPAQSPADYRINLARDAVALRSALQSGDFLSVAATIDAVADDLEVKLEHCTRSGGKLGGSVVVRVRTVRGREEARSWQVFYIPRVLEAAGGASPDVFPRLSSPTDETLVPGRYVMWVRHPETNRTSERTVVKVGEGKRELQLDLAVPADPAR